MKFEKTGSRAPRKIVVNSTITMTVVLRSSHCSESMYRTIAKAIAPLMLPPYHITHASLPSSPFLAIHKMKFGMKIEAALPMIIAKSIENIHKK